MLIIDMFNDYDHPDAEHLADLIYVNDNHGNFTADRHSVFYSTALDYLLDRLKTQRLVLAGQVTEQCILYSALDGYLRHYEVVVPPDAVAHIDDDLGSAALKMMERNMSAELVEAAHCLP